MSESRRQSSRRRVPLGLGPREQEAMVILRSLGSASVAEVHAVLSQRNSLAYTTVMTILSRLASKGFADRVLVGNSYRYFPQGTEEEMVQSVVGAAMDALLERFGRRALAGFVSGLGRLDERSLAEMEDLIRRRKAEFDGDRGV